MQDRELEINGLRLHYVEWGDATRRPFLLLHGLAGFAHDWNPLGRALEDRHHLIALDQRGFGESDQAHDHVYSVSDFAHDVSELQEMLGLDNMVLLGHSLGGRVAIHYASQHPTWVGQLILVDSGPEVAPAGLARLERAMAAVPARFDSLDAVAAHFRPAFPALSGAEYRARIERYGLPLPDGGYTIKRDPALGQQLAQLATGEPPAPDTWPLLRQIECPILLLHGARSDLLTPEIITRMQEAAPQLEVVEVPDVGHNIPTDAPAALIDAVQQFLATTHPFARPG
jgi:esterase